jgi:hypothetical protein
MFVLCREKSMTKETTSLAAVFPWQDFPARLRTI